MKATQSPRNTRSQKRFLIFLGLTGLLPVVLMSVVGVTRNVAIIITIAAVLAFEYPLFLGGTRNPWSPDGRPYNIRSYLIATLCGILFLIAYTFFTDYVFGW